MAVSTVTKIGNDGSIALEDGTGGTGTVTLTVPVTIADFSVDGLAADSSVTSAISEVVAIEARGTLDTVRATTRVYPTGSFTCHMREFTNGSAGTLADFIMKSGSYSANISTLAAGSNADVYTIKITLTVEATDHGDAADATIALDDCYCTIAFAEGDPNTFTISFTCYGTIARTGIS